MASKKGSPKSASSKSAYQSHRAFQPILPCGNKLLQQKWDKTYYDEHKRLVKTAKPMVDSGPPPARPHVTAKWKKQQLEKERLEEIDRDNMTLLKKMQHIMKTEGCVQHRNTYRHHSLNEQKRQREVERVSRENQAMLKRLEQVEPMYKMSEWVDHWTKKEELTNMITSYPITPLSDQSTIALAKKIKEKGVEIATAEAVVDKEDLTASQDDVTDGKLSPDQPTAHET